MPRVTSDASAVPRPSLLRSPDSEKNCYFVFLFGLARSGTTWVGKIFDSHPQTLYKHEPDTFAKLDLPWAPDVSQIDALRPEIEQWLSLLPDINTSSVAGSLPVFRKAYRSWWQHSAHGLSVWTAKAGQRFYGESVVLPFAGRTRGHCLVWKSVNSLGRLGVLLRAAGRRKAIVLLRHPCGVIASLKRGLALRCMLNDQSSDYNLLRMLLDTSPGKRHAITMDDLYRMQPEERLAWKWVLVHEKVFEDIAGMDNDVLVLPYEDVCADPKGCARRMFQITDLEWNSQTEAFIERTTAPRGARRHPGLARTDYFSIFQDPARSSSRWRQELSPKEIERVSAIMDRSHLRRLYP